MKEKYKSLGHFGGTIVLKNLTKEEKIQLGGFFQKDYTDNKSISISQAMLTKALNNCRFSQFTWEEIIEQYLEEPLVVKKEIEQEKIEKKQNYFETIQTNYAGERGKQWLEKILQEKGNGYTILQQQYTKNKEELEGIMKYVLLAVERLPVFEEEKKRLPIFASSITGNPHFFDKNTVASKLLLYFIQDYFNIEIEMVGESNIEKRNALFYQAGIVKDDLSNYVLTYGLHATCQDDMLHEGIEGYYKRKEPIQITLFTLQYLKAIWGNQTIYVVENPSVFATLIEYKKDISVVCTNGQLRLSSLVLLDHLVKDSILLYAGDFDPEGLLIAQTLKERYREKLQFWKYEREYYETMKSDVPLSPQRLKKLQKITEYELQEIKQAILEEGKAGYQENMIWIEE